jgi:hypothetical protein
MQIGVVAMVARKKFASQCDPKVLQAMKKVADDEGRQFQAVLEDAMIEYLEHHKQKRVRSTVMAHFNESVQKNRELGQLLAK